MPRTKQARRVKQLNNTADETDSLVKDFKRQSQLRIHKIEGDFDMLIRGWETDFTFALSRLPMDIKKLSFDEIMAKDLKSEKENYNALPKGHNVSSAIKGKKLGNRTTTASDDGYVTEAGNRQSRAPTISCSKLRSRSSSRSRKPKLSLASQKIISKTSKDYLNQSKSSASKFKTPANLKASKNEFNPVTPKVKPNTPMSILRRPREGEMVLSMQGSPLLVSAVVQERSANVNVPLHNGDIISLLPRDGLRLSSIPNLDAETVRQLETLKGHIEKVINAK